MAKYRHKIFEMYEFRDEATAALTPRTVRPAIEATAPELWSFRYLAVSRSASVTHVEFKSVETTLGEDTLGDLRKDFAQLADWLARDSKVLLDFVGVESFCAAAIDVLVSFRQKLRMKGSRIALCCLEPSVRESFFAARSPHTTTKNSTRSKSNVRG